MIKETMIINPGSSFVNETEDPVRVTLESLLSEGHPEITPHQVIIDFVGKILKRVKIFENEEVVIEIMIGFSNSGVYMYFKDVQKEWIMSMHNLLACITVMCGITPPYIKKLND
jgi:hypothetical protein